MRVIFSPVRKWKLLFFRNLNKPSTVKLTFNSTQVMVYYFWHIYWSGIRFNAAKRHISNLLVVAIILKKIFRFDPRFPTSFTPGAVNRKAMVDKLGTCIATVDFLSLLVLSVQLRKVKLRSWNLRSLAAMLSIPSRCETKLRTRSVEHMIQTNQGFRNERTP